LENELERKTQLPVDNFHAIVIYSPLFQFKGRRNAARKLWWLLDSFEAAVDSECL
jgi:hypothetical protein